MRGKDTERARAIELRRKGKTYSEILTEIPVAKSTLSLWLRSVGLTRREKQRITKKRIAAQKKGAQSRFEERSREVENLIAQGMKEVGSISDRELWLIAAALYWAEGSKQHSHNPSVGVMFTNSDPLMIGVFIKWLRKIGILDSAVDFELYVHDNRIAEVGVFKKWWASQLKIPIEKIDRVYFKRNKPKTNRTNIGDLYHGLLRVKVMSSTVLNRKIAGWIHGIVAGCRIV